MEDFRTYILSVTAASILCAVLTALAGKGGSTASLMKLMSAVVLAAVIISPVANFTSVNLNRYLDDLNDLAAEAVANGTEATQESVRKRIIEASEAYILDKAALYELDIDVTVELDEEQLVPTFVEIQGAVSPAARRALEAMLQQDLGIPPEAQRWK